MKVKNETQWDTRQLRAVFARCRQEIIRREQPERKDVGTVVQVGYARRGYVTGCARYFSRWVRITLPSTTDRFHVVGDPDAFVRELAEVYIHEVGHNLGVKHQGRRRAGRPLTMEAPYADWIRDTFTAEHYPLTHKAPKAKMKPDVQSVRYQQAQANLARATKRLKLTQTLHRKWRTKVRYYERALAKKQLAVAAISTPIGNAS